MTYKGIRITGPHEAVYQLGHPMSVYEGSVLLATLDPVLVLNGGTQIHVERLTPTKVMVDERRHFGRLIFFEICALVSEHFPQVQAISFVFPRPIDGQGGPVQQAALRAAALARIGVEDIRVTPYTSGAHVVSGTWVYNEANLAALHVALAEQRAIFGADPIIEARGGVAGAIRRLIARLRPDR
ncbi:hypothetical protein AB4Z46_23130 [Variovorax sp. M-6]|uniref:hypothetical protein n=1 Tax=Variovorax sp. M-6 TaxID=3233041 RepID=UPI003F9D3212